MKLSMQWSQGMHFDSQPEGGNPMVFDAKAPMGKGEGYTPKEAVALAMAGCTAMDVIALMKKFKQEVASFKVEAEVEVRKASYPNVFEKAELHFYLEGTVDPEKAIEAVRRSQTQYCAVSAMLSKAFPIFYHVYVNGERVGSGQAQFDF